MMHARAGSHTEYITISQQPIMKLWKCCFRIMRLFLVFLVPVSLTPLLIRLGIRARLGLWDGGPMTWGTNETGTSEMEDYGHYPMLTMAPGILWNVLVRTPCSYSSFQVYNVVWFATCGLCCCTDIGDSYIFSWKIYTIHIYWPF